MEARTTPGGQTEDEVFRILAKVTAEAQADDDFRAKYFADPDAVLREAGLDFPSEVTFRVRQANAPSATQEPWSDVNWSIQDDKTIYLVYPDVEEVVQDESMATAAAASCDSTASTAGTVSTCVSTASSKSSNSCS